MRFLFVYILAHGSLLKAQIPSNGVASAKPPLVVLWTSSLVVCEAIAKPHP